MSDFTKWLVGLIKDIFKAVWDFLTDILISMVEMVLQAVLAVLGAIPLPAFMTGGSFQGLFNSISTDVLYFASKFRLAECFAILGAAVLFRLMRKALTLFQW